MIKTRDVLAATGLTRSGLSQWVTSGDVKPVVPGRSKFSGKWSYAQALGLYVARNSRRRGATRPACMKAFAYLSEFTEAALRESCGAGHKYLMIVGNGIIPRLMTDEEAFHNPHIDIASATQVGIAVVTCDVAVAIAQVDESLAQLDSTESRD